MRFFKTFLSIFLLSLVSLHAQQAQAKEKIPFNGFDLSNVTIDKKEIQQPLPKDAIPAIHKPKFTTIAEAETKLKDTDKVLHFSHNGVHRAYPLRILDWHEVVNDDVAGKKVSITYCPLCGSGIAFAREFDKKTITLAVSGLLYRSDVLLYDKETNSLWSQLGMKCVAGPQAGTEMLPLVCPLSTFAVWKMKFPTGQVLSFDTGHKRPYSKTAYQKYKESDQMHKKYGLKNVRTDLPVKTWVFGINTGKSTLCISEEQLMKNKTHTTVLDGKTLTFSTVDGTTKAVFDNKDIPAVRSYWFAWQAFNPETKVIK